jgi:hypothetical protein
MSRRASRDFFNTYYKASEGHAIDWTGNHATCDSGETASGFRDAVLLLLNYFRAMAGVPSGTVFSDIYNSKAQKTALMMSVNNSASHNPPTSWKCYSADGAEAAGESNLYLGVFGWDAITGYVADPGSGNYFVGHRRWILYPQTQIMGTGDVPFVSNYLGSNALWVFDSNIFGPRPSTREEFVAWPPPGYVPYQVVFPRWSLSYPSADFSAATVRMTSEGANISVDVAAIANGYGENTIVWIPMNMNDWNIWPKPNRDTVFSVVITNVLIGSTSRDFQYAVTVFDPDTSSVIDLVTEYYNNILDRPPEPGGAEWWTAEIERIVSLGIDIKEGFIAVGKAFFNSTEYLSKGKTGTDYVLDLYKAFLSRTPSQPEIDFHLGYMAQGVSRNEVLNNFIFSPEFIAYVEGIFGMSTVRPENNLVNDFYRGILSRLPDTVGFNYWLGQMRAAQCAGSAQQIRDLAHQEALGFIQSTEYIAMGRTNGQYVEDLYDAVLRRAAEPNGLAFWLDYLSTHTREQALQGFTDSNEFKTRVQAVIDAGCL